MRVVLAGLLVAALVACGGTHRTTVAGCLNGAGFLVSPSGVELLGTSPGGVAFTLTLYRDAAAARRVPIAGRRSTRAVVGRAVADWSGNPSRAARLTRADLRTIRGCLAKAAS